MQTRLSILLQPNLYELDLVESRQYDERSGGSSTTDLLGRACCGKHWGMVYLKGLLFKKLLSRFVRGRFDKSDQICNVGCMAGWASTFSLRLYN